MDPILALRGLICEDDPDLGAALRAMLQRYAVGSVTIASSASDTLAHAARVRPEVILVDIALTGELGVRLVPVLRSLVPHAVIVVLSPFVRLHQAAIDAGADELIDIADLLALEACLQHLPSHGFGCSCAYMAR